MNIFVLSKDPKTCAKYHNDKHVVKMVLESAQLLSTAHYLNGSKGPYKPTHTKHPCATWTAKSLGNYIWLGKLAKELCKEYTYRYEKKHKSEDIINWLIKTPPKISKIRRTKFALAMPKKYQSKDPIQSYQKYYINDKSHLASWKKRNPPKWFIKK